MSYTTQQSLIERFGQPMMVALTDRADPPAGEIDGDVVARALVDTGALIDGYLAGRYTLPLSEPQPLVAALAQDIAIYKLHPSATDPKIEADYKAAIKSLEAIAAGTIRLVGAAGIAPVGTGGTGARLTDRDRPMTEAGLRGLI